MKNVEESVVFINLNVRNIYVVNHIMINLDIITARFHPERIVERDRDHVGPVQRYRVRTICRDWVVIWVARGCDRALFSGER